MKLCAAAGMVRLGLVALHLAWFVLDVVEGMAKELSAAASRMTRPVVWRRQGPCPVLSAG